MDKKTEILQLLDKAKEQHGLEKAATLANILKLVADPLTEEEWKEAERPLRPAPKKLIGAGTGGRNWRGVKPETAQKDYEAAKGRLKALRAKVAAVRNPEWPNLKAALPEGFVRVISPMQEHLYESDQVAAIRQSDIEVRKEAEKAVQVYYLKHSKYSPEVFEWWPKSQIVVEDGRVVAVKEWFANKNRLPFAPER